MSYTEVYFSALHWPNCYHTMFVPYFSFNNQKATTAKRFDLQMDEINHKSFLKKKKTERQKRR